MTILFTFFWITFKFYIKSFSYFLRDVYLNGPKSIQKKTLKNLCLSVIWSTIKRWLSRELDLPRWILQKLFLTIFRNVSSVLSSRKTFGSMNIQYYVTLFGLGILSDDFIKRTHLNENINNHENHNKNMNMFYAV